MVTLLCSHVNNIESSASGKPPVFGIGIPQVRILPTQLRKNSGVMNDGVLKSYLECAYVGMCIFMR